MGIMDVDQIGTDGSLLSGPDTTLSEVEKNNLLLTALPGANVERYASARVIRFGEHVILKAQVTHLGFPWPESKKRIQIPKSWVAVYQQALADRLTPHFVGIYRYGLVTVLVDFDPGTYVRRKANNSAAHVSTNDLFQAQTLGQFSRKDRNGNRLTSVRADLFATYLRAGYEEQNPHIKVLDWFSRLFLDGAKIDGLTAVQEMHAAGWPDMFQNEWAGFYVEFRLDAFLREHNLQDLVLVQKEKRRGEFDYDLRFLSGGVLQHYGDLKASNISVSDSPGNDQDAFTRCLSTFGRFWYVIYEHETWHGRDSDHVSTIAWNSWKRSVGFDNGKPYNELSYATRYKEAVRFARVKVLEVNRANMNIVLGDFQKDFRQPDGTPRKSKVMIKKRDIDNFLIYTREIDR